MHDGGSTGHREVVATEVEDASLPKRKVRTPVEVLISHTILRVSQRGHDPYRAPRPTSTKLTQTLHADNSSGHDAELQLFTRAYHRATKMKENMPYFQSEDLDAHVLASAKSKNVPKIIDKLATKIDQDLSKRAAQAITGGYVDKNGAVLMYYLADTVESTMKTTSPPDRRDRPEPTASQLPPPPPHLPARPVSYTHPQHIPSSRRVNSSSKQPKTRSSTVSALAREFLYGTTSIAADEDFEDLNEYAPEANVVRRPPSILNFTRLM